MKICIIGCSGHFAAALQHGLARGLCAVQAVSAAGDGENTFPLESMAKRLHVPFYHDWREMLRKERLELAVVDSRYDMHAAIAGECLARGLHVYCEKPLATDLSDLDSLRAAWNASGKALGGMFSLRYCSWFLAVQQAIRAGEIGDVRMVHGQKSYRLGERPVFFRDRQRFGGLIPWVAIHAIDWALALGGHCQYVSGMHSAVGNHGYGDLEVGATVQMRLENDVLATVSADYFRPNGSARHDDDRLRVTGSRGVLEARDGRVYLENDLPKRELPLPEAEDSFCEFLAAIANGTHFAWGRDALESTYVSLLARQAADSNATLAVFPR